MVLKQFEPATCFTMHTYAIQRKYIQDKFGIEHFERMSSKVVYVVSVCS